MAPNEKIEGVAVTLPEWLKPALFEDILKKNVSGYKEIINFRAERGVAVGENFSTVILRVKIDVECDNGKVRTVPFLMKVPQDVEWFNEFLEKHNVFQIESEMLSEIIPELEQMYQDAGKYVKFAAQSYKLPTSENYILLEDLQPRGFRNVPRLEGLDKLHTKSVLKKLAQFHAASATRVAIKGNYHDSIVKGVFVEAQKPILDAFLSSTTKILLECMKKYKGHEEYIVKVEKLNKTGGEKFFQLGDINYTEFNVLNHGDCWSNNIMFKYDAFGNVKETYFVDFQGPKYGSPAQDLLYFIISSLQYEIKLKQFDNLIKFYHENLIENLVLLKYPKKIPTLKDIHILLLKYGLWAYNTAIGTMAAVLCEPTNLAKADNFLADTDDGINFKLQMYSNDRYVKHMEAILPWLNNRGVLDV